VVPARRPPRGRRAAVVPACRHDNGKLSTPYHTSKIHHIFVRLPTKFGVIPSRFLFFMNFGIFNGRKIQINNSRFLKIQKKILQLDWIFPNLCAKFQLQIIFFEGFRGGGQLGPSSVSPCQSSNDTYCSLGGLVLGGAGGMVPTGPPRVLGCCAPGGKWGSGWPHI